MPRSDPRDPATLPRALFTLLALVLLWPGLVLTEFRPASLVEARNLDTFGRFLAGFWPPDVSPEFIALLGKATLETLAMASAGLALAIPLAIPLSLLTSRA
ncbi:MAG: ABC transporter permease, partial [Halopseudomonas sp.]